MAISFDQIPVGNRLPGTYVEVDPTRAVSTQPGAQHRTLIVGLMLASGTATPNEVIEVEGETAGDGPFGAGAQLAEMIGAFKQINRTSRLFALPISEAAAGVAATSTILLAGTATKTGILTVRIGSDRVSTVVPIDTLAVDAATLLEEAINAVGDRSVDATTTGATVTLTSRHKGFIGNDITIAAEVLPEGVTATVAQPTGGAGNPDIAAGVAAIDDSRYDTMVNGLNDDPNVTELENELDRRWGPTVKQPGHQFVGYRGTYAQLVGYGTARNSQYTTVIGSGLSPTPPWIWAAQVAAQDALQSDAQPNRPRNGLELPACEAPLPGDRLDGYDRESLLHSGVSTFKIDQSDKCMIERLITTYQLSPSGSPDITYLAIETVRNLANTLLEFVSLGDRHQRDMIAPDGTEVSPGVPVTTPRMLRGEIGGLYQGRIRRGLAKDYEGFMKDLVVEINEMDPERMDVHAMPRFINGLVTLAVKLSFQL